MVSTLKVTKIQIPNSDSDVISLDASTGNITFNKTVTGDNNHLEKVSGSTSTQTGLTNLQIRYISCDRKK